MRLALSRTSVPSRLPPIVNDKRDDKYLNSALRYLCDRSRSVVTLTRNYALNSGRLLRAPTLSVSGEEFC